MQVVLVLLAHRSLNMTLDDLIDRAAPPLVARDAGLAADLRRLAIDNETDFLRRKWSARRALTVAAAATVAVLGVGGIATASGLLPSVSFPWTTSSGERCQLVASVELRRDAHGDLLGDGASAAEQQATLTAARTFLAQLDLRTIDRQAAAERWFDYLEAVSADHPDRATLEHKFTGDRLETHAMLYAVDTRLQHELEAEGHDPHAVMTTIASVCGE